MRAQIGAKKISYVGPDKKLVVEKLDADSKAALLSAANYVLKQPLEKIETFSLSASGVRIDLVNELPHAVQAAPSEYTVRWETLDKVIIPAAKERILAKK
ncbi:MAG: hypothetical protein U0235_29795 [Polyangiaceae bacterium]